MAVFIAIFILLLGIPVIWPDVDILISGLFFRMPDGFFWADNTVLVFLHNLAKFGSRALALFFAIMIVFSFLCGRLKSTTLSCLAWMVPALKYLKQVSMKAWLFLLLALLVGPGLVANVGFKDNWGRSRPREIVEFGGSALFSPALAPQFDKAKSNGSFVCGDGAFGFFFPAFAFVVSPRLSRRIFWGGMAVGAAFSFARLAMGAHFFGDIVYAAALMLLVTIIVHALLFGFSATRDRWRGIFGA